MSRVRILQHARECVVTVGPNLDWLADDEANLRPEVARDLQDAPPPPAPPAAAAGRAPMPGLPQPPRPAAQPYAPAAHTPSRSTFIVPILLGVIAALIGFGLGAWLVGRPVIEGKGLALVPTTISCLPFPV